VEAGVILHYQLLFPVSRIMVCRDTRLLSHFVANADKMSV
jgi:hypothetical protein